MLLDFSTARCMRPDQVDLWQDEVWLLGIRGASSRIVCDEEAWIFDLFDLVVLDIDR